jgi:hypothetical protein
MDYIRQEASRILALEKEHSKYTWPPRLVFRNRNIKSEEPAAFEHLYAGFYRSSASVETWLSEKATPDELATVTAARDREMGETPASSLRVTAIHGDGERRHILHMDRHVFSELIKALELDEYALYLYLTNVPGLHFLGEKTPSTGSAPVLCFYLNAIDYTMIWSYNQRTRATNVLLIGEADAKWETNQLLQTMRVSHHIVFNPLYLAFLACSRGLLTTWECDAEFTPWKDVVCLKTMELSLDSDKDLSHFSEACLWVGKSLLSGEKRLKMLKTLQSIANQLDHGHADSLWAEIQDIIGATSDACGSGGYLNHDAELQKSTAEIQAAMRFLHGQLASRVAHFEAHIRWAKVNLRLVSRDPSGFTSPKNLN